MSRKQILRNRTKRQITRRLAATAKECLSKAGRFDLADDRARACAPAALRCKSHFIEDHYADARARLSPSIDEPVAAHWLTSNLVLDTIWLLQR
ncbi:hypothetical protein [Rhodopseudomonas sp.]|uniref:hypothetical protein n=1 Tax=Rhodopseudomonas sp. TaxID=1078 RepID=UPI003B3BE5EE